MIPRRDHGHLLAAAGLAAAVASAAAGAAHARPNGPSLLCQTYPSAPACQGRLPDCYTCHTAVTGTVSWNAYGDAVRAALRGPFDTALPDALHAVEQSDADGDGQSNLAELLAGTAPGDATSRVPAVPPPPADLDTTGYAVAQYDPAFAYRRVMVTFCGTSPTYEQTTALAAAPDARAFVHRALDECLRSTYWLDEALPRLADTRIRPLGGASSCMGYYANFEFDYQLFAWALSGDRDARDLLVAQYHVVRDADHNLAVYQPPDPRDPRVPAPASRGSLRTCRDHDGNPLRDADGALNAYSFTGGEPLQPGERAGMITTQWFMWFGTMGTYLPRSTAAQAYRAYLGYEIASLQGLFPVANEPHDYDAKGVGSAQCSGCHSTLDPLSYAFASYWGGTGSADIYIRLGLPVRFPGVYDRTRPSTRSPGFFPNAWTDAWRAAPPTGSLFGEALPADTATAPSLVAWARRAADSEPFRRNLAEMFFAYAVGREPGPGDWDEFNRLWRDLPSHGHTANGLLHQLVDTLAFGAP